MHSAGALPAHDASAAAWHNLSIFFEADCMGQTASISIDGNRDLPGASISLLSGTAGFGSGFHAAYFDDFRLDVNNNTTSTRPTPAGSFLLDIAVSGPGPAADGAPSGPVPPLPPRSNVTGWVGAAYTLSSKALRLTQLARFQVPGNQAVHELAVFRAADGARVPIVGGHMQPGVGPAVNLVDCESDLLGFCYSYPFAPVTLNATETYYVVSREAAGGDAFATMSNPASASDMAHRIGSTVLSHRAPGFGRIAGRVLKADGADGAWELTPEVDTMHGPVNWVVEEEPPC